MFPPSLALRLCGFHSLEVTRHTVRFPGLDETLRLVHLTDFHCDAVLTGERIREVVEQANGLDPDLVVMTGDYATRRTGRTEECVRELARLTHRLGIFAVLGNHDHENGTAMVEALLRAHGIEVLTNRSTRLDNGLWLAGLDDVWEGRPDVGAAFAGIPEGAVPLLLTHSAIAAPDLPGRPMVALCGDTHGGQVYVPWLTQQALPGTRPYIRGWYRRGQRLLFVNRGIGTQKVPVRFNARPEIAVITLVPAPAELSLE